jgi:4-carboxymuconolactone decarboxylase
VDYIQRLRALVFNQVPGEADMPGAAVDRLESSLDPKTSALVRLGALVAVGGAVPSYGALSESALDAGASLEEVVDVLFAVIPVVGTPRAVAAAPLLALVLGHDTDELPGPQQ